MIYSPDDVRRMLDKIWQEAQVWMFFYKDHNIPPKVISDERLAEVLNKIKGKL